MHTPRVQGSNDGLPGNDPILLMVTPRPAGVDQCWALDAYTYPPAGLTRVAELFSKAKYHGLGPPLMVLRNMFAEGAELAQSIGKWPANLTVVPVGSSCSVPLALARAASAQIGSPLVELFLPPTGMKAKDISSSTREAHAKARVATKPGAMCPPNVLLVDDLVETGATFAASAAALRSIGVERVFAMAAVHIHR